MIHGARKGSGFHCDGGGARRGYVRGGKRWICYPYQEYYSMMYHYACMRLLIFYLIARATEDS
jgi:hypothetical protein